MFNSILFWFSWFIRKKRFEMKEKKMPGLVVAKRHDHLQHHAVYDEEMTMEKIHHFVQQASLPVFVSIHLCMQCYAQLRHTSLILSWIWPIFYPELALEYSIWSILMLLLNLDFIIILVVLVMLLSVISVNLFHYVEH